MTEEPTNGRRFLTPTQAAEELNVKPSQIHAMIKAGELRALQVGGRGMWRVGRQDVEDCIAEAYRRTAERIAAGEIEDEGAGNAG
ncbi:excisionase family DNA binding protein [Arthrobacter ulcerisalmonis]|nr:helix-turn-helix domain-containing protein [Arthrobacter ulcerisalmonis]MDQ0664730.1 excisionase family DNA binding protein [Arthrobacter ulcerisalmonis]